ncbi:hypothetical protein CANARDRAFT_28814 [[Candida] arabinofermentans NRRL YB-2248]|uniref:Uncharacterized protein n=1 Tax=[Candida] arabinofermentans NRRL YB-2248 TaxID=983967 RepID=A0A1E4T041_9ASCO|nr:hypothetical protein CANARDRAFT_28814 [[Candida] arabinofermentans NRRL YB-2248]
MPSTTSKTHSFTFLLDDQGSRDISSTNDVESFPNSSDCTPDEITEELKTLSAPHS